MSKTGSFSLSIAAFVEKTKRNADEVLREATLAMLGGILETSPVDTGRFRGNWNVGIENPDRTVTNKTYPGASPEARGAAAATESIARGQAVLAGFERGETIWLSNNLPYSIELEYGHSKQAPSGIVRLAIREYRRYLERAAAALSTK